MALAMNITFAFTGSYTETPFCYQQGHVRYIKKLRGRLSTMNSDAAHNCRLYVTTMKAMNFQDDIPALPCHNFEYHYLLVFDFTSMQDTTENCKYRELVVEPLRLALIFSFPLEHVTELIVWGERVSLVAIG